MRVSSFLVAWFSVVSGASAAPDRAGTASQLLPDRYIYPLLVLDKCENWAPKGMKGFEGTVAISKGFECVFYNTLGCTDEGVVVLGHWSKYLKFNAYKCGAAGSLPQAGGKASENGVATTMVKAADVGKAWRADGSSIGLVGLHLCRPVSGSMVRAHITSHIHCEFFADAGCQGAVKSFDGLWKGDVAFTSYRCGHTETVHLSDSERRAAPALEGRASPAGVIEASENVTAPAEPIVEHSSLPRVGTAYPASGLETALWGTGPNCMDAIPGEMIRIQLYQQVGCDYYPELRCQGKRKTVIGPTSLHAVKFRSYMCGKPKDGN